MSSLTVKTLVGSLAADSIALAVAFGASLTTPQQAAILGFVGAVTSVGVAVVGWVETHRIKAAAKPPAPAPVSVAPPS